MWRRRADGTNDPHDERVARWSRRVTIAFAVLFLFVVCRWRPWDLFARGGFSADFYDSQAHAFWRLHLDVPATAAGMEGFLIDGKTYLYYGPTLAIARMPFALFGHWADGRLVAVSLVAGFVALCTAAFHLALEARHALTAMRPDRDASHDHWRVAGFVAAVACSPALFLTGWVSVYHETELWAAVFITASMVHTLALWRAPARRHAVLAIVFVFAAVLTRATVGIGAAVGLGLVGLLFWRRDRHRSITLSVAAFAALGTHMVINLAKFGTLLDLPADRQVLTLQSPSRAAWFAGNDGSFFGTRFLTTTVLQYLRPDAVRVERLLPVVRFGPAARDLGSYRLESNTPASSLTASATLLFILGVVGLVVLVRRRQWAWVAVLAGATIAAVPSFLIGFIANRYLVDMLPMLMVPAAIAALSLRVPSRQRTRRVVVAGVGALVAWGTLTNVALATWNQNLKDPGFTAWRYQVDDALFGNPAPGLITLQRGAPVPRDGIVALDDADDGTCAGVYIAEQRGWAVLERGPTRHITGEFTTGDDTTLLDTGASKVALDNRDGHWSISVEGAGATNPIATPVRAAGSSVRVDVVADPISGGFEIRIDGTQAWFSFEAIDLATAVFGPAFAPDAPAATPLCDELRARR